MLKKIRTLVYKSDLFNQLKIQKIRDKWVEDKLNLIMPGGVVLDAGCGSQRYRITCGHLKYKAQDFGKYTNDATEVIENPIGGLSQYIYGELDYVGNIWEIDEKDEAFDAILCTEVLEHLPYPNETIKELSRLTKKEGYLILTAPTFSLKHMDPYHYYTGFTDRWFEHILNKYDFEVIEIKPVSDYYRILAMELARTASIRGIFSALFLLPAFVFLYCQPKSSASTASLCYGYHVLAKKRH